MGLSGEICQYAPFMYVYDVGSLLLTLAGAELNACGSRRGRIVTILTLALATTLLAGPVNGSGRCGSLAVEIGTSSKSWVAPQKDIRERWEVADLAFAVNVVIFVALLTACNLVIVDHAAAAGSGNLDAAFVGIMSIGSKISRTTRYSRAASWSEVVKSTKSTESSLLASRACWDFELGLLDTRPQTPTVEDLPKGWLPKDGSFARGWYAMKVAMIGVHCSERYEAEGWVWR
jgi:hypothetical protein